jgi:hypothetical protein
MKSIYSPDDNQKFIERINKLTEDSKPIWGKMSVNEMLAHCHCPMDVALGNLNLKANFVMRILGKLLKNKILNSKEFQKNSPTAKEFIIKGDLDFITVKKGLIERINTFSLEKENAIKNKVHPFFGKMSNEEWSKLQTMHLDHHLKQFGV